MLLALYKPYGVLSQFTDEDGHPGLARLGLPKKVYSCGRLDRDSEGLLLLTDDGDLHHRLTDPRFHHEKTYWAQVEREPSPDALRALAAGPRLADGPTRPCRARLIPEPPLPPRDPPIRVRKNIPTAWVELVLTEGRNRQVRRMTAAVGHPTLRLARWAVGRLTLAGLEPGRWREVSKIDVGFRALFLGFLLAAGTVPARAQFSESAGSVPAAKTPAKLPLQCPPFPAPDAEALYAGLKDLRFTPGPDLLGWRPLGQNVIARGCSAYPHGGDAGFGDDLAETLRSGLPCLRQANPQFGRDVGRLLALFSPKVDATLSLFCGKAGDKVPGSSSVLSKGASAAAFVCGSKAYPTVAVRLDVSDSSRVEFQDSLFHELLHLTGYDHGLGIDIPFLAAACCFNGPDKPGACKMLKTLPDWTTGAYQEKFAEHMVKYGSPLLALESGWASVAESEKLPSGRRDASGLFEAALNVGIRAKGADRAAKRQTGLPLISMILARAALENVPPGRQSDMLLLLNSQLSDNFYDGADPALKPVRSYANMVGFTVGEAMKDAGNLARVQQLLPQVEALRAPACAKMSAGEKAMLRKLGELTRARLPALIEAEGAPALAAWTDPCP